MSSQLRYRLLGLVVLLGLLLIIVPLLFDNAIRYRTVTPAHQPALPAVNVVAQPQKPGVTPVPVRQDMLPLKAHTIQVVSFKETATVNHLLSLLQKDGFAAYSRQSSKSGFTTIYVGPVLNKDQANSLLLQLTKKYKVKPVIVSYTPQEA